MWWQMIVVIWGVILTEMSSYIVMSNINFFIKNKPNINIIICKKVEYYINIKKIKSWVLGCIQKNDSGKPTINRKLGEP